MSATYGAINPSDFGLIPQGRFSESNINQNLMGRNLVNDYGRQESQKIRMANESEKQMKIQTKAMQDAFDKQKAGADTSGTIAFKFLEAWGSSLNEIKGMYGDASTLLKGLMSGESGGNAGLDSLSSLMRNEYTSYREQYAPVEKQMMTAASETAQGKAAIQREIAKGGGTWTDTEGAAARAKADAGIQGELQNQAEARKLMSMGVDPSSGRFGALTRKGAIETAGETVRAMNLARQTEKTQGLGRAISAAGALNPAEYSNIGTGIRKGGTDILTQAGALETANLNAKTSLGTAYGNLTYEMGKSITDPLAEMAGYYSGLNGGNTGAITNPATASLNMGQSPTVMQGSNTLTSAIAKPLSTAERADALKQQRIYGNAWASEN